MRPSLLILATSLVANVLLAAVLLRKAGSGSGQEGLAHSASGAGSDALSAPGDHAIQTKGGGQAAPSGRDATLWSQVYSDDLHRVVDGLKAAGFAHREVVSIVRSLVDERSNVRRMAVTGETAANSYWQPSFFNPQSRERQQELQRLMEPDMKVYRQLTSGGGSSREDPQSLEHFRRTFGPLPDDKLKLLIRIDNDYGELMQQVASSKEIERAAMTERINLLNQERERDMQAALTAEEFERYQLRSSQTANYLRSRLDPFQPSEEEFIALHKLHEAVRAQFPQPATSRESMRAYQQSLEALNPQIEAALGPERYADYRQTLIESSQRVNNLLVRLELPLRTGGRIEEVRQDLTQRAEAVRTDVALTPAERAARLGALQQEARQRVGTTLGGERNLAAYEDIKGWIRDLR